MTLTARTLTLVLDTFQRLEGIWRSSIQLSYQEIYVALGEIELGFAEWDPERGLYFLDFSRLDETLMTSDITMLDFSGPAGNDHFRFEWTDNRRLGGVELQTHAPGPLPLLPEIEPWLFHEQSDWTGTPLGFDDWQTYLTTLQPQSPPL